MIIPLRLTHQIDPVTGRAGNWRPWRIKAQYQVIDRLARYAGWIALDMTRGRWVTGWMRETFAEAGLLEQFPDGIPVVWTRALCTNCERMRRQEVVTATGVAVVLCASCGLDNDLPDPIPARGLRRLITR